MNDYNISQLPTDEIELTVAQFLDVVNNQLRRYRVVIVGEITSRINRRGGVTYFSLHDPEEDALIDCMAFNSQLDAEQIELKEGMAVKISGAPEVWKRYGRFSFKVNRILLRGEGELKKQYERLLKQLQSEGLFESKYKVSLPAFARSVGLITSEGREAQTDFQKHLASRGIKISLYDVRVEGAQAVDQICRALEWFNKYHPETEVLVLTRGGGSLESLQAFNSEAVARAIFASRIPVISAVGHEKDVTIADLVADVRASTPTDAGKILSHDWDDAESRLSQLLYSFIQSLRHLTSSIDLRLNNFLLNWQSSFESVISDYENMFADRIKYMHQKIGNSLALLSQQINYYDKLLIANNPSSRLKQGYSIVRNSKGDVVKSIKNVSVEDVIIIGLHDGSLDSKVTKIN